MTTTRHRKISSFTSMRSDLQTASGQSRAPQPCGGSAFLICFVTGRGTVRVRSAQDISTPFPAKNRSNIFMCMCMCITAYFPLFWYDIACSERARTRRNTDAAPGYARSGRCLMFSDNSDTDCSQSNNSGSMCRFGYRSAAD